MATTLTLTKDELACLKWLLRWDGKTPLPPEHIAPLARLDFTLNPEHHTL